MYSPSNTLVSIIAIILVELSLYVKGLFLQEWGSFGNSTEKSDDCLIPTSAHTDVLKVQLHPAEPSIHSTQQTHTVLG